MITYLDNHSEISANQLVGFFAGWSKPLTAEQHLLVLHNSSHFVAAVDEATGHVVGYVTALTDGMAASFIPFLEVLPSHQAQGIGTRLMEEILHRLRGVNNVDLMCDPAVQPFYERFQMRRCCGMVLRR